MPDTERSSGFLARWSERKLADRKGQTPPADHEVVTEAVAEPGQAVEPAPPPAGESAREPILTDADMPPLESLDSSSDYSGFLSRGVSATLRREALSRLFHSPHLGLADHLDDFPEDYTRFAPLGDLLTADRRHQLALAACGLLEQGQEVAPAAEAERTDSGLEAGGNPPREHRLSADPPPDSGAACTSSGGTASDEDSAPANPAGSA